MATKVMPWLLIAVLATLAACANRVRTADIARDETYSQLDAPLRFLASRPSLSAVGKDYLFMAPVTVSRNGQSQVYLWFALGSTIDRPITGAPEPTFSAIVIDLDGMLMTFDIIQWADIASGDPFALSVNTRASYGARVTRSQLARISAAREARAFVTNAQDRSPVYVLAGNDRVTSTRW